MKTIAISGASGFVGQNLINFFETLGYRVYPIRRDLINNSIKLQEILKEELKNIIEDDEIASKEDNKVNTYIDANEYKNQNEDMYEEDEDVTVPIITDYVEFLAEDVYFVIEDDNDESIVSLASLTVLT